MAVLLSERDQRSWCFARCQVAFEVRQAAVQVAHLVDPAKWETTTVEFKRQVTLDSSTQKGEFVKDILGLATSKASGRDRYLIIGCDDESHAFAQTVGSRITQDRLEQILSQYTEPMPEVRYITVPMPGGGEAGVIEVRRDPARERSSLLRQ